MKQYFHMQHGDFKTWVDVLVSEGYDWKQVGISDEYCNELTIPRFGLKLISWPDRAFQITDEQKYLAYVLRYQ